MNKPEIKILSEDSSIIIIEKPAGLATQTADVRMPDCVSLIKAHIRKENPDKAKEPYVGVIHRLDQPVAGLLVFAKTPQAAGKLSGDVRDRLVNKHYLALVEGLVDVPDDTRLEDQIYKDPKTRKAVIADDTYQGDGVRKACLIYRTEKYLASQNCTILSIDLITGRFHQIRAQLSHLGHPIVGDRKYGAIMPYPKGIALAADRLEFIHPDTGDKIEKVVDFSFSL